MSTDEPSEAADAVRRGAAGQVAILLCAGYGTRMGELTERTPKPLLQVAGRALIDPLLDQIAALGAADGGGSIDAVHIVTNHRHAAAFEAWARTRAFSVPIVLHDDGSTSNDDRLGAIGDLDFVLRRFGATPAGALVVAGDNILRFSLQPFWRAFTAAAAGSRILALEERDRDRLRRSGVLELDGDRVVRYHEKPAAPPSCWSSPACYALGRPALDRVAGYLEDGGPRDEIGRFIAHLVAVQEVRAHRLRGERLHVGHPAELERAERVLSRHDVITSSGDELPS